MKSQSFPKLTICFYQDPTAYNDIISWAKNLHKRILSRQDEDSDTLIFILEEEKVLCYPISKIDVFKIENYISGYKYGKTILIGKFDSNQLLKLSKLVKKLEQ